MPHSQAHALSSSHRGENQSAIVASLELKGGCLCGGVEFVIAEGTMLRPLIACHCEDCRQLSGSFVMASKVESAALSYKKRETLRWYASSSWARRAFCHRCGSQLFYQTRQTSEEIDEENLQALNSDSSISIMLGAFAHRQGDAMPFVGHIFTSQAHPALEKLSCSPMCKRWDEQPLIDALVQLGWEADKDNSKSYE